MVILNGSHSVKMTHRADSAGSRWSPRRLNSHAGPTLRCLASLRAWSRTGRPGLCRTRCANADALLDDIDPRCLPGKDRLEIAHSCRVGRAVTIDPGVRSQPQRGRAPRRRTALAAAVRCFPAGFLDHMNHDTVDDDVGVLATECL